MKKWIYGVVIFILFLFLLNKVDLNLISYNIKLIPFEIFIFSLILQLVSIFLIAYQWHRIASNLGLNPRYGEILKMNLEGNIIDGITPGSKIGGELSRVYILKNRLGYGSEEALLLLSLQKIISISSFTILSLLSLIKFISNSKDNRFIFFMRLVILVIIFLAIIMYFLLSEKFRYKIFRFLKIKNSKILLSFRSIDRILKRSKLEKSLLKEVFLGLTIWILYGLKLFLIVKTFNKKLDFLSVCAVSYITYMLAMIPILPGSIGSFEASMVGLFYLLGLETRQSLSIAIVFRFTSFWFELITSALIVLIDKLLRNFNEGGRYVEEKVKKKIL